MADDYTPTTEEVRGVIAWRSRTHHDDLTPESFDRWLAAHDAERDAAVRRVAPDRERDDAD